MFQGGSRGCLLQDSVNTVSGLILGRLDRKAHPLGNVSADEASDGVILPAGRFGDLGCRCSLFPAKEFEDYRFLGTSAGSLSAGGRPGSLLAG